MKLITTILELPFTFIFTGHVTSGRHRDNADATGVLPLLWKSASGMQRFFYYDSRVAYIYVGTFKLRRKT